MLVVFDTKFGDLGIYGGYHHLLRFLDLGARLWRRADDVERAPGQHTGDRIEVGSVDVAADTCRLERDRPAAAKRVRHLRPMTIVRDTQLLDQVRQILCVRAEVAVHVRPDTGASSSASSHSSGRRTCLSRWSKL